MKVRIMPIARSSSAAHDAFRVFGELSRMADGVGEALKREEGEAQGDHRL